jgi:pyridoxal phosphate enzyme (YggS family)
LKAKLQEINRRIAQAARACGREPDTIHLVAVSKTMNADRVRLGIEAGVTILGENYIQEARKKIETLGRYPVAWHFIGHLQTNKAKYAVRMFDLIHTVDSRKLAAELAKEAGKIGKIQRILIQVNIGGESSKSGVHPDQAQTLIEDMSRLEHLSVQGLMIIPPFLDDPEAIRPYFSGCRKLAERIRQAKIPGVSLDELSMGMTGDFEIAIEEGATLVRIGTAIFGRRK